MKKYETIILMRIDISEEKRNEIIDKIKDYIKTNGEIIETKEIGEKELAYPIREHIKGYYYCIEFETEKDTIYWLEQLFRQTEEVLKSIIIRKED